MSLLFFLFIFPSYSTPSEDSLLFRLRQIEEALVTLSDHIGDKRPSTEIWHNQFNCSELKRPLRLVRSVDLVGLEATPIPRKDRECTVLYAPGRLELSGNGRVILDKVSQKFEATFLDDPRIVNFMESRGKLHHFDSAEYAEKPLSLLTKKRQLVSFVFPSWHVVKADLAVLAEFHRILDFQNGALKGHIYLDDNAGGFNFGSGHSEQPLDPFSDYFFTIIYHPLHTIPYPPIPFLKAFEAHTIPITLTRHSDYWLPLGFRTESAVWRIVGFDPKTGIPFLTNLIRASNSTVNGKTRFDEILLYRQLNMRIMQDLSSYRYNLPSNTRLIQSACAVCRAREGLRTITHNEGVAPQVFIAIFSARDNFALRQTVRQTWLSVLSGAGIGDAKFNYAYAFFIGEKNTNGANELEQLDDVLNMEAGLYGDLVTLAVPEDYRLLTKKSLLMYHWVAENAENAAFLLRVDDDMYVRPQPILDQLSNRTPARYWWGSFAHLSSVMRNETEYKSFNSREQFDLGDFFPMYTRGVLYVLSMDLLRLIVEKDSIGELHTKTHPDDTALGVYMFQLITRRQTFINTDDRDENRVALNPFCKHIFSQMQNTTWAVHHVTPSQIRCMWKVDVDSGYYLDRNIALPGELERAYAEGMAREQDWSGCQESVYHRQEEATAMANKNSSCSAHPVQSNITVASTPQHRKRLYVLQVHEMIRRSNMSADELAQQRVMIKGRRRNNFPDLCPCGSPGPDEMGSSDYDSAYGRFMP